MCLGAQAPAMWLSLPEPERESRGELSSDQCVIDDSHYFFLGRIILPVSDGPEPFVWLAWVSLSEENFLRASELWDSKGRENEPAYFGWLQSALPYEPTTLNLKTMVQTQPVGERPIMKWNRAVIRSLLSNSGEYQWAECKTSLRRHYMRQAPSKALQPTPGSVPAPSAAHVRAGAAELGR